MLTGDASAYVRQRQRQQPRVIIGKKQVCAFVRQVTRQHRQQHRPLSHPHSVLPPPPLSLPSSVLLAEPMELPPKLLPFEVIIVGGNFESVNVRPDC